MRSAVAAGLGLNLFNRHADKLYMCNIAQIVNVLQSLLVTDGPEGRNCVRTTTYHAFSLFKSHRGKTSLRVETDGVSSSGISASASSGGGQLVLSWVNPMTDKDFEIDCAVRGLTPKCGSASVLHDSDWNAFNSFQAPDRVVPKAHAIRVENSRVQLELPRMSVVTAVLAIG